MKHLLTFTKTYWAVILVAAIGFETYGCSDSASVSEDVAVPLSSLTITPGNLQPGFFKNTTSYTVKAPTGATTVTVTATPKDSTTTMTINGAVTASGQGRSVSLGTPGSTVTILIVLSSQNGLETTYTVTVTRLLSGDNNLKTLAVTPGTMTPSPFDMDQLEYTVKVADKNAASISVSATKSDPDSKMVIGTVLFPAGQPSGQTTIPIGVPGTTTPISVVVTAPNGSEKTYRIIVNHLSDDNSLKELLVEPDQLQPTFDKGTTSYSVDVAHTVGEITVTARLQDPNATMLINGQGISSGERRSIPLEPAGSPTRIEILVIAPNGAPNLYVITVNRAAPSSNNNLSDLIVKVGTTDQLLSPTFTANTLDYVVNVAATVEEVTVSATKDDPDAVLNIAGVSVPAGTKSGTRFGFPLLGAGNDTPVEPITITAPNGTVKNPPYTLIVKRAAPAAPLPPASAPDMTDASDSGTNNTDNITSIGTPSFVVPQPAAGETPSIYVNGSKVLDATFDSLTNTFTLVSPLTDGPHTITSTVTNTMTTLESLQSPPLPVTIDPAAP